jgi:hypothetical protein
LTGGPRRSVDPAPTDVRTVDLCAEPGGWDHAARIPAADLGLVEYCIGTNACATARAAGHQQVQADMVDLDFADFTAAAGLDHLSSVPVAAKAARAFSVPTGRAWVGRAEVRHGCPARRSLAGRTTLEHSTHRCRGVLGVERG